jgi:hypothetical protein
VVGLGNACFVCVVDDPFDPQNRLGLGDPPLAQFPGCGSGRDSPEVALTRNQGQPPRDGVIGILQEAGYASFVWGDSTC